MNSVTQATQPAQNTRIGSPGKSNPVFKRMFARIWDILKEKDPPHRIALGLALGIFIGFLPIMGIQMAVVTLLAIPLRGNLKAALAGVWVSNPVTFVPLYWANYLFGTLFCPKRAISISAFGGEITHAVNVHADSISSRLASLLNLGADILVPLWVGSTILGVSLGILTYVVTYRWIRFYRRKDQLKTESAGSY